MFWVVFGVTKSFIGKPIRLQSLYDVPSGTMHGAMNACVCDVKGLRSIFKLYNCRHISNIHLIISNNKAISSMRKTITIQGTAGCLDKAG